MTALSLTILCDIPDRSLGGAFHGVRGSFYPTVGIDSACPIEINVGAEPFAFDLASALRDGGQEAAAREVRLSTVLFFVVLHRTVLFIGFVFA